MPEPVELDVLVELRLEKAFRVGDFQSVKDMFGRDARAEDQATIEGLEDAISEHESKIESKDERIGELKDRIVEVLRMLEELKHEKNLKVRAEDFKKAKDYLEKIL